ncbi:hypothetical protein PENSPDRAFT_751973 [Peniophora sp. CONT]|nr:hypothetical protein PENSPDRAFT_751973 [Peniophora sp. CONT]
MAYARNEVSGYISVSVTFEMYIDPSQDIRSPSRVPETGATSRSYSANRLHQDPYSSITDIHLQTITTPSHTQSPNTMSFNSKNRDDCEPLLPLYSARASETSPLLKSKLDSRKVAPDAEQGYVQPGLPPSTTPDANAARFDPMWALWWILKITILLIVVLGLFSLDKWQLRQMGFAC